MTTALLVIVALLFAFLASCAAMLIEDGGCGSRARSGLSRTQAARLCVALFVLALASAYAAGAR